MSTLFTQPNTSHHTVTNRRLLAILAVLSFGASIAVVFIHLAIVSLPTPVWLTFTGLGCTAVISLVLITRQKVQTAAAVFILATWFLLAYVTYFLHSDINSPLLGAHLIIVIGAGLLFSPRYSYILGILSTGFICILYLAKMGNLLPAPILPIPSLQFLIIHLVNLGAGLLLVRYLILVMGESDKTTQIQAAELRLKNQELENIRTSLDHEVEACTTEILQQKRYYEALVGNNPLAIVTLDNNHQIVSVNQAFERLFGYTQPEVLGKDLDMLVASAGNHDQALHLTKEVLRGQRVNGYGQRFRKDGQAVDVEIFGVPVIVDGEQIGILGLYQDITERKRTELALQASEEQLRSFFENANIGMVITDVEGNFTRVNQSMASMLGYSQAELLRLNLRNITHPDDIAEESAAVQQLLDGKIEHIHLEKRYLHKSNALIWGVLSMSLVRSPQNEPLYLISQVQDISERKRGEEQLHYLATRDMLTDLPNRYLFVDRLELAIAHARRNQQEVAVLFLDLDGFKQVNDTLGHQKGDVILQQVAQRIRSCPRESDTLARLGGDEFGLILENTSGIHGAQRVAEKILASFILPFEVTGCKFSITTSIGISLFPSHSTNPENLIKHADSAMYTAKSLGGNRYNVFTGIADHATKVDELARNDRTGS